MAAVGVISTDLRHTIAFTVLLKRKLWSRYLLDLGASVGLKEHELISIIATAHRLLYLQAYKSPVFPWDAYPIRLWLDVLLHESVSFNCAISSRTKTRAFLVAIREKYPMGSQADTTFQCARSVFQMRTL